MSVVRDIFLDRHYRVPSGLSPGTILDLGAHVGVSVKYFLATSQARVVAVEADPKLISKLQQSVDCEPRVTVIPAAATAEPGPVTFYSARESWASSLSPRDGARPTTVDGMTIRDILARAQLNRVDLVKLNIEGAEWPLLEHGQIQAVTDCIVGELHHDSGRTVDEARRLLDGFTVTTHGHWGTATLFTARRSR